MNKLPDIPTGASDGHDVHDVHDGHDSATTESAAAPTTARVVGWWLPHEVRLRLGERLRHGRARRLASEDLLATERLPALARESIRLLGLGGAGFALLIGVAAAARHAPWLPLTGAPLGVRLLALVVANLIAYALLIPAHEGLHALAIVAEGGRPSFGLKLPFAAYCTAAGQLFPRGAYLAVALAPLVALTVAGAALCWLWPAAGASVWLGLAGNVAGAAGDLVVARHVSQLPAQALIEDTATGFVAYQADA